METQYTRLSMTPLGVPPVIYMSQNDIGRPIGFVCDADLSNYAVVLEATRTDGTPITVAATVDGNICAFETTATMTNKADVYIAQIVVTNASGKHISSIPIKCVVILAAMNENSEGIEEDAPLYQQYTGTVQSLIADIRTQLNAETAARQAAVSAEASARQAADNQLQSNINTEASTRATQDASLQSQINQLVAPSGEAPSAAEVENARVGADGTVYPTLGDAIRTQVTDVKSALSERTINQFNPFGFGNEWHSDSGVVSTQRYYASTDYIDCNEGEAWRIQSEPKVSGMQIVWFDAQKSYLARANLNNGTTLLTSIAPTGAKYVKAAISLYGRETPPVTTGMILSYNVMFVQSAEAVEYIGYINANDRKSKQDIVKLSDAVDSIVEEGYTADTAGDWQSGNISIPNSSGNTTLQASTTRISTLNKMPVTPSEKYHFVCEDGYKYRVLFFVDSGALTSSRSKVVDGGLDDGTIWHTDQRTLTIPQGALGMGVSLAKVSNAAINTSEHSGITIYKYNLANRVGAVEDRLEEFESNYEKTSDLVSYAGKTISILGDSISTFAGANAESAGDGHTIADGTYTYPGNHCRYPNSAVSNADDTYWMKLINSLNMRLGVNDSWAGSMVSWNGAESTDWGADIYMGSQTRINHLGENGTPDIILVNGGTNDIGRSITLGQFNTESPVDYTAEQIAALPVATFADAYRAMLIRLQKTYPLAKVIVMLPNYTTIYYDPEKADRYLEVIKEACDYFGVPYVDMRTTGITMYNASTYLSDGIHPNVSGMNMLYKKLAKAFLYQI